jgi:hypothetical protein
MKYLRKLKLYESIESDSTTLSSALDTIQKEADAKKNQLIESLIDTIQEIFYDIADHDEMKSATQKVERKRDVSTFFALDTKVEANLFTANGENITEQAFQSVIDCIKRVEMAIKIKPSGIDFRHASVREITNPSMQIYNTQRPLVKWENDSEKYLTELKDKFRSAQISHNTFDARALVGAKKVFIWIRW